MRRHVIPLTLMLMTSGACVTFKNATILGLNSFPPELTKSVPLEPGGPYVSEPESIVGRIVYLRNDANNTCPTVVTKSGQLSISTDAILPPGQAPSTKEPATEPLVDGKLDMSVEESGAFGPVAEALTGKGVYTIRILEVRYAISPGLPSEALRTEANRPLPGGFCRRYWVEYAQVIHAGSTLYTKVEGNAAGGAAAFQVNGNVFAESTNHQNRYIVNLGLRELIPGRSKLSAVGETDVEFKALTGSNGVGLLSEE